MQKLILFLFLILFPLLSPFSKTHAHGGVQGSVGNITVTFFQDPFSPIINKNVVLTFLITDRENGKRLEDYPAILKIKETVYGQEDKDKTVFSKEVKADVNGVVVVDYVFKDAKIYDVELELPQIKEEENDVGFLLEPRKEEAKEDKYDLVLISILALISGIFIGHKANSLKSRKFV